MATEPEEQEHKVELRVELREADLERLVVIGGDLEYLRTLPQERLLTHTEVRLCAGVLRRMLVDDELGRLWRSMQAPSGIYLSVDATDIDGPLSKWPEKWVRYAWAGGAPASGAQHSGMIFAVVPRDEHEPYGSPEAFLKANPLPMSGERRRMAIPDWLRSTSVAIQTNEIGLVRISRASVLKYIANRKGGVHFDPKRNLKVKHPRKARREAENHLLDHGLLRVGHLSGPEYEVASMAQAVATSDWARELIHVAREVAPAEFSGNTQELKFWTGLREADGTGWATSSFGDPVSGEGSGPD